MKKTPSTVKQFLKDEVAMLTSANMKIRGVNGWVSTSQFVLKHGRAWARNGRLLPKGEQPAQMGLCFCNAAKLALGFHRNTYIYCEGYAMGVFPMPHAWCVDVNTGHVIDPTWAERVDCRDYFGIAFKAMYLQEHLLKHKTYGLIDAWQARWPLLTAKVEDWKHPINETLATPHGACYMIHETQSKTRKTKNEIEN